MVNTYGLLVYYSDYSGRKFYHLTQRRDTLAYIHFLRGKVPDEKLPKFLDSMTQQEKRRLKMHKFDDLWADLYSDVYPRRDENYDLAKRRFTSSYPCLLNALDNNRESIELEWSIPKGRKKHPDEPDLVCGFREYREETNNHSYLEFVDAQPLSIITPMGSQLYYIAKSKYQPRPRYHSANTPIRRISVSEETNDVVWASVDMAKRLLHPRLFEIIEIVNSFNGKTCMSLQDAINKYCPREKDISDLESTSSIEDIMSEPPSEYECSSIADEPTEEPTEKPTESKELKNV